ncbi:MAG: signal peptidase I [Coriobacteriia bacterium]|nr:signal peptidase I [Coriobacteriia bacterium]
MTEDLEFGESVLSPIKKDRSQTLGRWVVGPLALVLLAFSLVFYVFYSPSTINGDSMLPTLDNGERILTTKGYDSPQRGDVVSFETLDQRTSEPETLIKRVIAVPGDTIEVVGDRPIVNGVAESRTDVIFDPQDSRRFKAYQVPAGTVYVMGDNRPISLDSRFIGPIRLSAVKGRAEWVWAPVHKIRKIQLPR